MWVIVATATDQADPTMGALILTAIGVGWLAGYVFACWFWPFAACRRCKGTGRRKSPSGKAWRNCPRCKGTGRRLRTGRRIFNFFHLLRKDAS